jgi:hypothetical protein
MSGVSYLLMPRILHEIEWCIFHWLVSVAHPDLLLEAATVMRAACFLQPNDLVIWLWAVPFTSAE